MTDGVFVRERSTGDTYRAKKQKGYKGCVIDGKRARYTVQSTMVGGYLLNTFYCKACFDEAYTIEGDQ